MKNNVYFVSGIDTNIGKTYVTGILAREWTAKGRPTITQKLIQTGNSTISEDIEQHRRLMGIPLTEDDQLKLTMPEIFSYPCSPHLAAQIDKREIDFKKIKHATDRLSERYDAVLIEGAGGLMVPLTEDYLIIDYVKEMGYPLIFVTSGKLGSINHTLLSLEAIRNRKINLHSIVYNSFPVPEDKTIKDGTEKYLRKYMQKDFPETDFIKL